MNILYYYWKLPIHLQHTTARTARTAWNCESTAHVGVDTMINGIDIRVRYDDTYMYAIRICAYEYNRNPHQCVSRIERINTLYM